MKRAILAVALTAAAATALVALPSRAFERSKGNNGLCLWWRARTIPVVANVAGISPSVLGVPLGNGCAGADAVRAVITSSLATWHSATLPGDSFPCTDVALEYAGDTASIAVGYAGKGSDQNLILFRRGLCSSDPRCECIEAEACADQIGCWPGSDDRTIAVTTTSYIQSTGEIVDADMELHDRSAPGSGFDFTCTDSGPTCAAGPTPACISTDLASIVTHEAGHMLGLDHPKDKPDATMFATYVRGSTSIRILDVDDVEGICTIYPRGQQVLTCVNGVPPAAAVLGSQSAVESSRSPVCQAATTNNKSGGGCSTATGGVLSMMGVALALARGRRRRERSAG